MLLYQLMAIMVSSSFSFLFDGFYKKNIKFQNFFIVEYKS